MRFAVVGCTLFAMTALSSPIVKKQVVVTDNVVVTDEVIVTVMATAGSSPTSSPAAAVAAVTKQAVPQNNWNSHTWSWTDVHPQPSTVNSQPAPSSSTTTPSTVPTTTAAPPPLPTSSTSSTSAVASTTSSASPSPSSQASDGSPLSGGVSLLTTINKWRKAYSLSNLAWDSTLQANAQKTGTDDKGVNENHELNPGSMAQVITPGLQTALPGKNMGGDTPFELAYVSWLCEVATDPQLSSTNQCSIVKAIENMVYSDTGHHDILNSPNYSKIGCAFAPNPLATSGSPYQGLWVCDLA